jgi:hypothetical protein
LAQALKSVSRRGFALGESITYNSEGRLGAVAVKAMTGLFSATAMS